MRLSLATGGQGKIEAHPLFEKKDRLDNDFLWG